MSENDPPNTTAQPRVLHQQSSHQDAEDDRSLPSVHIQSDTRGDIGIQVNVGENTGQLNFLLHKPWIYIVMALIYAAIIAVIFWPVARSTKLGLPDFSLIDRLSAGLTFLVTAGAGIIELNRLKFPKEILLRRSVAAAAGSLFCIVPLIYPALYPGFVPLIGFVARILSCPFNPGESTNLDGVGHSEMSHSVQDRSFQ